MPTVYQYFVEDADLAVTEVPADAAEEMRLGEWEGSTDLPVGVEYAEGCDKAGKPMRLHRVVVDGEREMREESYELSGPPVMLRRTFNTGEVSFSGGPFDGEVVPVEFGVGAGSDSTPEFPLALSICFCAVDGGDGKSILGRQFSDGTNTYKVESVELSGGKLTVECVYVGRTVSDP